MPKMRAMARAAFAAAGMGNKPDEIGRADSEELRANRLKKQGKPKVSMLDQDFSALPQEHKDKINKFFQEAFTYLLFLLFFCASTFVKKGTSYLDGSATLQKLMNRE